MNVGNTVLSRDPWSDWPQYLWTWHFEYGLREPRPRDLKPKPTPKINRPDLIALQERILQVPDWTNVVRAELGAELWWAWIENSIGLPQAEWVELFRRVGYCDNRRPAPRPASKMVTLYRGSGAAIEGVALSWTAMPWLAAHYATLRVAPGDVPRVWSTRVDTRSALGRTKDFHQRMLYHDEILLDPADLVITEYAGENICYAHDRPVRAGSGEQVSLAQQCATYCLPVLRQRSQSPTTEVRG